MKWLASVVVLVACATSRSEQPRTSDASYFDAAWWVCRPDLPSDACRGDLTTTVIAADGTRTIEPHAPARDATVDCFYIYPTVDLSIIPGNHVDFSDLSTIRRTAAAQIARLSEVCNVFAPLYRQATIATYFSTKGDQKHFFDVAYSDVAAAFDAYLARFARGHKLVIIGHSQGSQMAARLLQERFDRDPAMRARLLVAMPIGFTVDIPNGATTGGTFTTLAPCKGAGETGCVLSYLSIRDGDSPNKLTNRVPEGHHALCVSPTARATLRESVFPTPKDAKRLGVTTPYVAVKDFYAAHCTDDRDGRDYLALKEVPQPDDRRPHLVDLDNSAGGLGLHRYDLQFTQGDLIELVRTKSQ
jgi:pimeloyl-ACP methyl ester carboxylesterase